MSNFEISNKLSASIRKQWIAQSKHEKCFVIFYVFRAEFCIASVKDAQAESCFRNNSGLIYFLNNCQQIPMLMIKDEEITFGQLPIKPEAKPKKGFGKE